MLRLQDISIKRKLTAIIMVASTMALVLAPWNKHLQDFRRYHRYSTGRVSGGFVGYELITRPETMAHHLAARAEIIGLRLGATPYGSESDHSLVTCSADNAVLNFNDSPCGINTSKTPATTTAIPQGLWLGATPYGSESENEWEVIACVDNP